MNIISKILNVLSINIKAYSLIFIFLSNTGSYAQINNFAEYKSEINKAELFLVNNQKENSLDCYVKTFQKGNGTFVRDIYNALVLSSELNLKDTFFILLDYLIPKCLTNEYINSIEVFNKYQNDKRWNKFLEKNKTAKRKIDLKLKQQIDQLHVKDQFFRIKEGSYEVFGDTINKIDKENINFLLSLISSNKFPGEDNIGVDDFDGRMGFDIVFHHYTQKSSLDNSLKKITKEIIKVVQQGKICPNKASHWLEMQNSGFDGGVFSIQCYVINGVETPYYCPNYSDSRLVEINKYRKWLFLEPYNDYLKKVNYFIKNPNTLYKFDIILNRWHVDEKEYQRQKKNLKEMN